jgi:hypothetical protein
MQVSTIRENDAVLVSAGYAQSYQDGRNCTPQTPRTDIFALLYAQVMQADGKHFRNVLISQRMLLKPIFERDPQRLLALKAIQERAHFAITGVPAPYILPQGDMPQGNTFWHMKDVRILLLRLGIDINAPLSVMTIELMPPNDHVDYTNARHLGSGFSSNGDGELALDKVRILRTSRLCKLSDSCPVSS